MLHIYIYIYIYIYDISRLRVKYKYGLNTKLPNATPDCEAGNVSFSKHTFITAPHFLTIVTDDSQDRRSSGVLRDVDC